METWVVGSCVWMGALKVPLCKPCLEFTINPTIKPPEPRAESPQAKQLPRKGETPPISQIIGLDLLSKALPTEQDPVFPIASPSTRNLHKSLSLIHQRGRQKKHLMWQAKETKTSHGKLITMKKRMTTLLPDGEATGWSRNTDNEVEWAILQKKSRIMIVNIIQDLGKRMSKD